MATVSFGDTAYYPNWLIQRGYDPNEIGLQLSRLPMADRNAPWMKYRGRPVKQSKFYFIEPDPNGDLPVYSFTGFQYESVLREYRNVQENPLISGLQQLLYQNFGIRTNHVVGTAYYDKNDTVGWHQDKVDPLEPGVPIFIFSFFASRPLSFRNLSSPPSGSGELESVMMEHGSLLVLGYYTNQETQHAILPLREETGYRISLSFRAIRNKMSVAELQKKTQTRPPREK